MQHRIILLALIVVIAMAAPVWAAQVPEGANAAVALRLEPAATAWRIDQIASTSPGNVLFAGESPTFTFVVTNLGDAPIRAAGRAELLTYSTLRSPTDSFTRSFVPGEVLGVTPFAVDLAAKGSATIDLVPAVPARFGAYALAIELDGLGRALGNAFVRVPTPTPGAVQHPSYAMDLQGMNCVEECFAFFQRCGIKGVRQEIGFNDDPDSRRRITTMMADLRRHDITMLITSAAGGPQPMADFRKHLDDDGRWKQDWPLWDMCWLPAADDEFQAWMTWLAGEFGWPKGPVNAIELWNEPWEGCSISGWAADMPRYRELYERMALGIEAARAQSGVQVLIGGCCSSMNTEDKLFCDGSDRFLQRLDFTSIHYQPMNPWAVLIQAWNRRQGPYGPVRVWDTESWIANTEDRVASTVAAMRATGLTRTAGVLHDWTYRVEKVQAPGADGAPVERVAVHAWATAAAISATQHFVGERAFAEIVLPGGVPWVFRFAGLPAGGEFAPDEDGTLVVTGDLGALFERDLSAYRRVTGLANVAAIAAAQAALDALPADAPGGERAAAQQRLIEARFIRDASMTLVDPQGRLRAFDLYGNRIAPVGGKLIVPLDLRGVFLRGDGTPGAFAALVAAVRGADIRGYQPVEITARDFTARVPARPTLRLTVANMLDRPVAGGLAVTCGDLRLDGVPARLELAAYGRRELTIAIVGGDETADNAYPLTVRFAGGADGAVEHRETMHVNVIARRAIAVDGDLADWNGIPPQTASARVGAGRNLTEKAWLPMLTFDEHVGTGLTTAWLAYDDQRFCFAAKIADATPYAGGPRYATRDDDAYFYPEVSRIVRRRDDGSEEVVEKRWPEGVRRFSYRRNPDLPSGAGTDNLQLAFGVRTPGEAGLDAQPPGTMPGFVAGHTTDYEYALNQVHERFGGGTEIWRLLAPGVPRKHFYPRQPAAPIDGGPVAGELVMRRDGGTRVIEASLPWSELPEVKRRIDAGEPVRFTFRVNDDAGDGYELAGQRSASQINNATLHDYWATHWANTIEFAAER